MKTSTAPTAQTSTLAATPTKVRFPDGEVREYSSKLEAHAAKIIAGGGEIIEE